MTNLELWCDHLVTMNCLAAAKEPAIVNEPRHDALGHTCLKMPTARSTMTEMRADKLSGAAPWMHRKNSQFSAAASLSRAGSLIATLENSRRKGLNEYGGGLTCPVLSDQV